ncbi:class I SAM-dependent methyltransferase [Jatrophihabitans sp. DSM 45814]
MSRFPDAEAANLFAVDATDRLLLDEAAEALAGARPLAVIGDRYGALTLGAVALHGATSVRVHQDLLSSERALANNARRTGLAGHYENFALDSELLTGAEVVLVQAPTSLDGLREIAEAVARYANPAVQMYVGGRVKHMTITMNEILGQSFESVQPRLARQKSRVLLAGSVRQPVPAPTFPVQEFHQDLDLWVCAYGSVFAGTKIDIGTRYLLSFLGQFAKRAETAIDLGCGTGILAAALAKSRPMVSLLATDQSASAVASSVATMAKNGLQTRVEVTRDDAMSAVRDGSVDLVLCNPPFHLGTSIDTGSALDLFDAAGRVLRPGGELWTVFNSHLKYLGALGRSVGPTTVVGRNPKFTVAKSVRRT